MKIEFNVPDAKAPILVDALCKAYKYSEFVTDGIGEETEGPNPETKVQFAKRVTVEFWKEHVKAYEIKKAKEDAEENLTLTDLDVT